jgi:hypothetical protein
VAFEGVFFGAHEGRSEFLNAFDYTVKARLERGSFCDAIVTSNAVNVAFAFGAARAKFVTQEKVADVGGSERGFEGPTIELGQPCAIRVAADIDKDQDAMHLKQPEEMFQRVVRVADSEEFGLHVSNRVHKSNIPCYSILQSG